MPAGSGDFWVAIGEDLRAASPRGFRRLLAAYPDGAGGLDLQPFFDLITLHELGHAFEVLGELRLPAFWLGQIFANLALHAFVATRQPEKLETLEVLSTVGAQSRCPADRMRTEGYSTLEELQIHYTDGENPMDPLNYVWYQYRWQHSAAKVFEADGEDGLRPSAGPSSAGDRPSRRTVSSTAPERLICAAADPRPRRRLGKQNGGSARGYPVGLASLAARSYPTHDSARL